MSPNRTALALGIHDAAHLFAALGDERRLALVIRLCESGPLSIARLSAGTGVTRQAITKHLQALSDAGLVRGTRHGRERVWALDPRRLERGRRALGRLRAYL